MLITQDMMLTGSMLTKKGVHTRILNFFVVMTQIIYTLIERFNNQLFLF